MLRKVVDNPDEMSLIIRSLSPDDNSLSHQLYKELMSQIPTDGVCEKLAIPANQNRKLWPSIRRSADTCRLKLLSMGSAEWLSKIIILARFVKVK